MPLVNRFDTPGSLRDATNPKFYDDWHKWVDELLGKLPESGVAGSEFYNASRKDVSPVGERALVWMGFPRRQLVVAYRDNRSEAFKKFDERPGPSDVEPDFDPEPGQEEYLEWHVTRNAKKQITKVTFTTETPEYWKMLFDLEPATVVTLYRDLTGDKSITEAGLRNSRGAYNPRNRWNTKDGIIHYIVKNLENTLTIATGLAKGSVTLGQVDPTSGTNLPFPDNYQLQDSGNQPLTSADPRVNFDVNALARRGLSITLNEPIGIYMAGWDDSGWTKPNGKPVDNYWTIKRGKPGAALRVEYEVLKEDFVVSDLRIGGRRIEYGGQLAEHITVLVGGIAGKPA